MWISKREPRNVVVWGMTVIIARSFVPQGPLRITAGRTFWIMPRSTNQTSPRLGTLFLVVQHLKSHAGAFRDVVIRQWLTVEFNRGRFFANAPRQFPPHLALFRERQSFELLQNALSLCAHSGEHYSCRGKIASAWIAHSNRNGNLWISCA